MVTKALAVCISFDDYADAHIVVTKFEDLPKFLKENFDDYELASIKGYVIDPIDIFVDGKEDV